MSIYDWLSAIFVGFGFTAWAVWGKYYHIHPILLGLMSTSLIALTVTIISLNQLGNIGARPFNSFRSFFVMVFLCVVNGVAFFVYSGKIADKTINTGIYIVVVSVLMLVSASGLDWLINGNALSIKQIILMTVIITSICFL